MNIQKLDELDIKIINRLQANFPVCSRPYEDLAKEIGLRENELLSRVNNLRKNGYIRRLGAVFNAPLLGYSSTLCAAKVPEKKIDDFVSLVNSSSSVTHNYLRGAEYNVWFTCTSSSQERIEKFLEKLRLQSGLKEIVSFPSLKTFKIKVSFKL